jgi:hypothetical protein
MYCHAKMIALMGGIVFSSFFVVEFSASQCEAVTIVVMSVIFVKGYTNPLKLFNTQ